MGKLSKTLRPFPMALCKRRFLPQHGKAKPRTAMMPEIALEITQHFYRIETLVSTREKCWVKSNRLHYIETAVYDMISAEKTEV